MENSFVRNFLGEMIGEDFFGGEIFFGRNFFWEELFGRNSLFTLFMLFHYE